jgi:hypothetical protein
VNSENVSAYIQTTRHASHASCSLTLRYKKGSHPKGRNVFTKDIEPFIRWLEEAEEEEGEEH